SELRGLPDPVLDAGGLGKIVVLERVERERRVEARDARDRCFLIDERLLLDRGGDLAGQPAGLGCLVDDRRSPRLLERLDDRLVVERRERTEIDDLAVDALLGERLG